MDETKGNGVTIDMSVRPGAAEAVMDIRVWPGKKRLYVALPLPVSATLMAMAFGEKVCGRGAVCDAVVGTHLGGIAMCAKGDSARWRAELGLPVTP